ncbi:DUF2207 domain-containing protein [Kribbella lupini]|uniref:Membrane protein DUF2207 n=1 Tax=Kribbella lupini TaxID=291602 RepID=A0ABP4KZ62_9ACTN
MSRRRWWARALVVVAASSAALVVAPSPQVFAAPSPATEQVDSLTIDYKVGSDGVVQVTETIVYRFGESSGRHGIYRDLVVREPNGDDQDRRYDVTDVHVTSPTGADTSVRQEDLQLGSPRTKALRLRIGAPDRTVTGDTATYVVSYRLRGAIRSFPDHDELYWNATGRGWIAPLQQTTVTVEVPGGVTRTACYAGESGASTPCTTAKITDGRATYTQGKLSPGEQLTVVAAIELGQVPADTAILEDAAGPTSPGLLKLLGGLLALIIVAAAAVVLFFRWNRSAATGEPVTAPPAISVAESRLLTHGYVDAEATQATLVELALLGTVRLDTEEESDTVVTLVTPAATRRPHHLALLRGLFPTLKPGATVLLQRRRRPLDAQAAMIRALRTEIATSGWFARLPSRRPPLVRRKLQFVPIFLSVLGLALLAFLASAISTEVSGRPLDGILVLALVVVAGIVLYVVRRATTRGRLTRSGRELVGELRSFQRYLTQVRADDLSDPELAELLPWAMVLDRGDRWEELIAGGDPVSVFSSVGMFRIGRFRRGVAAFTAAGLVGGTSTGWAADNRYGADSAGSSGSGFSGGAGAGGGGGGGGGGSW